MQQTFRIVYSFAHPLNETQVQLSVSPRFNRTRVPAVDPKAIHAHWAEKEQATAAAPHTLFNALKFRLHAANAVGSREDSGADVSAGGDYCLSLQMGITDYKANIGTVTHFSDYETFACENTVDDYETCTPPLPVVPLLSQTIVVECLTISGDGQIVMFQRSQLVGELPGLYCCPGGHPEPSQLLDVAALKQSRGVGDDDGLCHAAAEWYESAASSAISKAFFDAAVMEVVDELGIGEAHCQSCGLLCLSMDVVTHKPELCFLVHLKPDVTAEVIRQTFAARNGRDAFESVPDSLLFASSAEVLRCPDAVNAFVRDRLYGSITPSSWAALHAASLNGSAGRSPKETSN